MCGRYVVTKSVPTLLDKLFEPGWDVKDDYNVAPTRNVPVVRQRDGDRQLAHVRWGFIPVWYPDIKKRPQPINARIETVATSGMFRSSFAKQRVIIPAAGYYEWTVLDDGSKQPHFISEPNEGLAMAGILSAWPDKTKTEDDPMKWLMTTTIITTDAHVTPGEVHDRCPALLREQDYDTWLDPASGTDDLLDLLGTSSRDVMDRLIHYPVSKDVNSVKNNRIDLMTPLERG